MEYVQSNIFHLIIESVVGTVLLWMLALAFLHWTRVSSSSMRAIVFSLPLFIPVAVTTFFHVIFPWRPSAIPQFKPMENLVCSIIEFIPSPLMTILLVIVAIAFITSLVLLFRQWLAWKRAHYLWLRQQQFRSQHQIRCDAILDNLVSGSGIVVPRLILDDGSHVRSLALGQRGYIFISHSLIKRLDDDELKALFAHEMAHIVRRDSLWGCLAKICRNLMWFNPLAHLALSKFEAEQEYAADDLAMTMAEDRLALASCLLKGYRFGTYQEVMAGISLLGNKGGLKKRIRRIMDMPVAHIQRPSRLLWLALVVMTGMATIALTVSL